MKVTGRYGGAVVSTDDFTVYFDEIRQANNDKLDLMKNGRTVAFGPPAILDELQGDVNSKIEITVFGNEIEAWRDDYITEDFEVNER